MYFSPLIQPSPVKMEYEWKWLRFLLIICTNTPKFFTWNPFMSKKGQFCYWICNLGQFYEARQIILSMKNSKSLFSGSLLTIIFGQIVHVRYRIVASTNTCYYSEKQLFVQRSQYIRTENPLHKQSEKAYMCFKTRHVKTLDSTVCDFPWMAGVGVW